MYTSKSVTRRGCGGSGEAYVRLTVQGSVVLLHPAVDEGLVVAEDAAVEFTAEAGGRAEGGQSRGRALLPFPLPDGIEVGVGDKVELFHGGLLSMWRIFQIWVYRSALNPIMKNEY